MTRINCTPVETIVYKYLGAEWRELPRLRHVYTSPDDLVRTDIPDTYRLGIGHCKFFYNKGLYLIRRHQQIYDELIYRGHSPNSNLLLDLSHWPIDAMQDWYPNWRDIFINQQRLYTRLTKKNFENIPIPDLTPTFWDYVAGLAHDEFMSEIRGDQYFS